MAATEKKWLICLSIACLLSLIFGITSLTLTQIKTTEEQVEEIREYLQQIPNLDFDEARSFNALKLDQVIL